jgi:multicomponent Na+:H+ antiporter subunit C
MELVMAALVGLLTTAGVWLLLSRNLVKFLMGLVLIGNVANLMIFASGGLTPGAPALIPTGADLPAGPVANPLPQALILTAIVIGFGLMTFALALAFRAYQVLHTVDIDQMRLSEQPADEAAAERQPDPLPADEPMRKAG